MSGFGCACGNSHDHDQEDQLGLSLQKYIDIPNSYCLNEHRSNAGKSILKPYTDRLTTSPSLQSPRDDDDLELLFHIPFTEAVSIRSISIHGKASIWNRDDVDEVSSYPYSVKVFANRNDLDFDTARELQSDLKLELIPPEHLAEVQSQSITAAAASTNDDDDTAGGGTLDYPLRPASKFRYCNSITLFFDDNYASKMAEAQGEDDDDDNDMAIPTEMTYIGFKGEGTSMKRVCVEAVYETRGMKKDHTVPGGAFGAESKPQT